MLNVEAAADPAGWFFATAWDATLPVLAAAAAACGNAGGSVAPLMLLCGFELWVMLILQCLQFSSCRWVDSMARSWPVNLLVLLDERKRR